MPRGLLPTLLFAFSAIIFFSLGSLIATRAAASSENDNIAALRAEVGALKRQRFETSGTSGRIERGAFDKMDDRARAALVADIKQQLKSEMGLLPVSLLRDRRQSFVELYSYDMTGASNYGTAGYLGDGYFVTVKHGVVALGDHPESRKIASVKIMYRGRPIAAKVVDTGDAQVEVDPGDWAILRSRKRSTCPHSTSISATASISPSRSSGSGTITRRGSSCRPVMSARRPRTTW